MQLTCSYFQNIYYMQMFILSSFLIFYNDQFKMIYYIHDTYVNPADG